MHPAMASDRVAALTRSGALRVGEYARRLRSEVRRRGHRRPGEWLVKVADAAVVLDFAGEAAVERTRFTTTERVLLRALFVEGLGCLRAEWEPRAGAADVRSSQPRRCAW